MHEVVLCADEEMLRNPSMMGLEDEAIEAQRWLKPLSGAQEARRFLQENEGIDEVWVASSEEVDPINLAAAMKRDRQEVKVCLVAWQGSGSLMSRASAAGIDEVLGYPAMARRYAAMKAARPASRRRTPEKAAMERRADSPSRQGRHAFRSSPGDVGDFENGVRQPAHAAERLSVADGDGQAMASPGGMGASVAEGDKPVGASKRGYALCVASASGGSGKSTVSALSSLIAAAHGYRTLLVDADLQFGDAAAMLGEEAAVAIDKVVAEPQLLEEGSARNGLPMVISAPQRMEQSELYLPQIPGLIDRALESFEVVIVNTGSFWTESHVQIIEACTNTLFLMDQRPTSVRALKKALELCARCGVPAHPFLYAVNRCTRKSLLSSIDISCALSGASVVELKEGGPVVGELSSAGLAAKLVEDRNELCVSLNDFLGGIIPAAVGSAEGESTLPVGRGAGQKGKAKRKSARRKGRAACL